MTDAEKLVALAGLANDSERKGRNLQRIEELKLVGNAYVGMAQRIRLVLNGKEGEANVPE